jgi:hypothetical protein
MNHFLTTLPSAMFFTVLDSVPLLLLPLWKSISPPHPFSLCPHFSATFATLSVTLATDPDATFCARMRFDALQPLATWDNDLDSETLVTLAIWYKAHDNRLRTFDWAGHDPLAFEIYCLHPST